MTDALKKYCELMKKNPELFINSGNISIIKSIEDIKKYEQELGIKAGVLYESKYNKLIVDIVKNENGQISGYERIVPVNKDSVVALVFIENKIVLLKQYRHAIRKFQYCFPRGFGEKNISAESNCKKEVFEEIGSVVTNIRYIGNICPDSGLCSSVTKVFECYADDMKIINNYEGIDSVILVTPDEFEKMCIEGKIDDSFTLASYMLWNVNKEN